MSLKRLSINSAFMTSVSMVRILAQFMIVPILTRFLSPEDYGVVALAMPFVLLSGIIARAGMGESLLKDGERVDGVWYTSFWLIMMMGTGLMLLVMGLAPLMAYFFETPQLSIILIGLAPAIFFQALSIVPTTYMRFDNRYPAVSSIQIAGTILGMGSAVIVALLGGGAWALVAQMLVMTSVIALSAIVMAGFRPRLTFNLKIITDHLTFGRDVAGSTFIEFVKDASKSMIIGKILGSALLGFYTIAFLFLNLAYRVIVSVMQSVIYAQLVVHKANKELLQNMLIFLTRALALIIIPLMAMIAISHEAFFAWFLSDEWVLSGQLFMIAAPALALQTVLSVRIAFMLILGRADINLRCNIELLVLETIAVLATVWFGLNWIMVGLLAVILLYQFRNIHLLTTHLDLSLTRYLKTLIAPIFMSGIGMVLYSLAADQWSNLNNFTLVAIAFVIGVAVVGTAAGMQFKTLKTEVRMLKTLMAEKKLTDEQTA
ncbi:MAG: oligosaccharide flippase family protein [Pseudomonadota bacterium]